MNAAKDLRALTKASCPAIPRAVLDHNHLNVCIRAALDACREAEAKKKELRNGPTTAHGSRSSILFNVYGGFGEMGELIAALLAAKVGDPDDAKKVAAEAGDVLFHVDMILAIFGLTLDDAIKAATEKQWDRHADLMRAAGMAKEGEPKGGANHALLLAATVALGVLGMLVPYHVMQPDPHAAGMMLAGQVSAALTMVGAGALYALGRRP